MLITLINHPTLAFTIKYKSNTQNTIFLGNVYKAVMPISLARVSAILEADVGAQVDIIDLRTLPPVQDIIYRELDLGDRIAQVRRIGTNFSAAREAIEQSDWIGFNPDVDST